MLANLGIGTLAGYYLFAIRQSLLVAGRIIPAGTAQLRPAHLDTDNTNSPTRDIATIRRGIMHPMPRGSSSSRGSIAAGMKAGGGTSSNARCRVNQCWQDALHRAWLGPADRSFAPARACRRIRFADEIASFSIATKSRRPSVWT